MREDITWTDLSPREIATQMDVEFDLTITPPIVRRVLLCSIIDFERYPKLSRGKSRPIATSSSPM